MKTQRTIGITPDLRKNLFLYLIASIVSLKVCLSQTTCADGWYVNGSSCAKCDDSCKTCSSSSACLTCESYMYLNSTTNLCQFCTYGSYFDSTYDICRACDGKCGGNCAYQNICFSCGTGQMLDTDTFKCVSTCASPKLTISSSQFSVSSICRGTSMYIDPNSSQLIELGTQSYPYKSSRAAFSELLNFHSHRNVSMSIYFKENSEIYIEDDVNFILNITSVTISSYSDTSSTPSSTTLIPTQITQPTTSKKVAFTILTNTNILLNETIQKGTFTSNQIKSINRGKTTFMVAMSNVYFKNINAWRDSVDISTQTMFIYTISMNDKIIDMRNANLSLTGSVLLTADPMNGYFDSITLDTYRLIDGFAFLITCNYPEADLINEVYFNNFTGYKSATRTIYGSPRLIHYRGPGNFTVNNVDFTNYYSKFADGKATIFVDTSSDCQPNDGVVQNLNFNGGYWSLVNNPNLDPLFNCLGMFLDLSIYRKLISNVTNYNYTQYEQTAGPFIYSSAYPNDEFHYSNSYHYNFTSVFQLVGFYVMQKVVLKDLYFEYSNNLPIPVIELAYDFYINVSNITMKNINISSSSTASLISLYNFQTTPTYLSSIYISNCYTFTGKVIASLAGLNQMSVSNSNLSNIYMKAGSSLVFSASVQTLTFSNNEFSYIYSLDDTDQSSSILNIASFDLSGSSNSTISNITVRYSETAFMILSGMTGAPSTPCLISTSGLTFSDSAFQTSRNLIEISNIELNANVSLIFDSLSFTNISYVTKGNLIYATQQLPTKVVVSNSIFTNLSSVGITLEASNKQNTNLFAQMNIINSKFYSINDNYGSLIYLNEGGILGINNCSFLNIFTYEQGSILFAGFQRTVTTINNTLFQNNTAAQGGIFIIQSQSKVSCTNCVFQDNFAISSGVAYATDSGYFEFYSSTFQRNYALSNPLSLIFNGVTSSIINNCTITSNSALTVVQINSELFGNCTILCFVPTLFKTYVKSNPSVLAEDPVSSLLQMISASIQISGSTQIYSESVLINAFISNVTISDSVISNISVVDSCVKISNANLILQNVSISSISNPNSIDFIIALLDSSISISFSEFKNSNSNLFNSRNSKVTLNGLVFKNITSANNLYTISDCNNIVISNTTLVNSTAGKLVLFDISTTKNIYLNNFEISDVQQTIFSIASSTVIQIMNVTLKSCTEPLYIKSTTVNLMTGSNFISNGNSTKKNGGALRMIDSIANIDQCIFQANAASIGGAISFECTTQASCSLSVNNTIFDSNIAVAEGGAIYYDFNRPTFKGISFRNNKAVYGANIASYPVKIRINGSNSDYMEFSDLVSGNTYNQTVLLSLVDYDNQTMVLDSVNQIFINPINRNISSIAGTNNALLKSGIASFSNILVTAKPGSYQMEYQASSKAIDSAKIISVFGSDISKNNILMNFRYCMPGEIQMSDNTCSECSPGTYSLTWNSTECLSCVSNAQCLGKQQISVDTGYWRRTSNSTMVVECLNLDACTGGFVDQINNPVNCATGYTGILCIDCQIVDGTKYQRVSDYGCEKCPEPSINAIRVVGLCLLVFLFIAILIVINIRKTKESQMSILMRIMTNYLQLISTSLSFNFNYPPSLTSIFSPVNQVGSSSETFMSFDCFITDYVIKGPFPSNKLFKLFLIALLPLILLFVFILIWGVMYCIRKQWIPSLKRNIIISFISIVFLLHPRLAESSLVIFQCIEIDAGMSRVRVDTNMVCYSSEHIKWGFVIGFPILVVWVICTPLAALILLIKNNSKGPDNPTMQYLLILYQGLKQNRFFWEFVNTLRKVLILMAFSLLITYPVIYCIGIALVILLITIRIQLKLNPYKEDYNNSIELRGIIAGVITLSSGFVFTQSNSVAFLDLSLLILVIIVNCIFIVRWFYLFCVCMGERFQFFVKIAKIMELSLCMKSERIKHQKDLETPKKKKKKIHKILIRNVKGKQNNAKRYNRERALLENVKKRSKIQINSKDSEHKAILKRNKNSDLKENVIMEESKENDSQSIHPKREVADKSISDKAKSYLIYEDADSDLSYETFQNQLKQDHRHMKEVNYIALEDNKQNFEKFSDNNSELKEDRLKVNFHVKKPSGTFTQLDVFKINTLQNCDRLNGVDDSGSLKVKGDNIDESSIDIVLKN